MSLAIECISISWQDRVPQRSSKSVWHVTNVVAVAVAAAAASSLVSGETYLMPSTISI